MPFAFLVRLVFWLWFAAALAVGHFRVLQRLPPPAVQATIAALTALLLLGYFRVAALRTWVDSLELRALVACHLTRFVGFYFLLLHRRGELPYDFAVPGGIGDIIVATLAVALILVPLDPVRRERAILIWNVIGLVDILLVIVTATRLNLAAPGQLRALTRLPLSLLPTLVVPLILATHIVIFARVRARRAQRAT